MKSTLRMVDVVEHPVIATVRNPDDLEAAIASRVNVVFLLTGTILDLPELVFRIREAGKQAFVHVDLAEGIAGDRSGVRFVAERVKPAGVISTRSNVVGLAREEGLLAVQRMFLIDSTALRSGLKVVHASGADAVEMMPGVLSHIIAEMTERTDLPIIAGGLVRKKAEVLQALEAGALAVSVGLRELWELDL